MNAADNRRCRCGHNWADHHPINGTGPLNLQPCQSCGCPDWRQLS